jgi:Leucine Rich repeats (2 copies)
MFERAERLTKNLQSAIQYLKRGRRERRLAVAVVACFSLSAILSAPASWLPFLQPLKDTFGSYLRPATYVLAAAGAFAFCWLAWLIYRTAQPPERLPEKLTPSVIKGPLSFGPQDGEFFQRLGRDNELRRILSYVKDPQLSLVVLMGESGAGKTSLLRAGLDYCCAEAEIPVVYWEAVPGEPVKGLLETVNRSWNTQHKTLGELLDASRSREAVIILDQFEQLDRHDPKARRIYKALLEACLHAPPHRTTWIVAFRRDYDPEWRDFELEHPQLKQAMFSLKLFNEAEAAGVMATIAEEAGLTLDEPLLKDLLASFRSKEGVSPVDIGISMLVLDNLAHGKGEKRLTVGDYKLAGGSGGVLTNYLSRQLERLAPDERKEIYKILLRLADLTKNKRLSGGKTLTELAAGAKMPLRLLEAELDRLSSPQVRLLERCPPSPTHKEKSYRLPHERLIRSLRELNGEYLEKVDQARRTLESSYEIWATNRDSQYLLGGAQLRKVLRHAGQFDWGDEAEAKQRFLRQSRKKRTIFRSATAAMILILSFGFYAGVRQSKLSQIRHDLEGWGLPSDLYEYQHQLTSLTVNSDQLTQTAWIDGNLKELHLKSQGLRKIDTLPSSVTLLDLSDDRQLSALELEDLVNLTSINLSNINIPDPKRLEERAGLSGDRVTYGVAFTLMSLTIQSRLTSLDVSNTGIIDMSSLKYLTNLTSLNLSNVLILLSQNAEYPTNLTSLNLSNVLILSKQNVEYPTNLTSLDLSDAVISNLAGLDKLTALTSLDLRNVKFLDIPEHEAATEQMKAITALSHLTKLALSNTEVKGLVELEKLPALTTLNLSDMEVNGLAELERLPALTTLRLSKVKIKSLAGIEKLPKLTSLELSDTIMTDEESLKKLTRLTSLKLSNAGHLDMKNIESLTNLTTLDMTNIEMVNPEAIGKLTGLTSLNIRFTESKNRVLTEKRIEMMVDELELTEALKFGEIIKRLPNLTSLKLSGIAHLDLLPTDKLTKLTSLDLSDTNVSIIAELGKLPNLTTLDLSNTKVTSLEGLEKCAKLKTLSIYGLNLSTLKGLPASVENLSLGNNLAPPASK